MQFKDWITHKLIEYEVSTGTHITVSEYANHIGVAQSVLSQWMNGTRTPSHQKSIDKLAAIFGEEVYQVLGKETTQRYNPISAAPPAIKSKLSAALADANQQYRAAAQSGIDISEEEASRILSESMARYGFTSNETTTL